MKSFMSSFPVSRHVRLRGNGVVGQGGFCLFQRVDNRCTEFRYAHAFFAGSHNDIRMSRRTLADFGRHFVACLSKIRSEEHTSELQSLMRISYAVFCLKKKKTQSNHNTNTKYNKKQKYN